MAETETTKDLTELVDGGMIAMFMTMIGDEHSSRPLTVAGVDGGRISFLVDRTTDWAEALDRPGTVVHVSIADVRKNVYLSLNGKAAVTVDQAAIERLWNPGAAAFFDGKDDPIIGVAARSTPAAASSGTHPAAAASAPPSPRSRPPSPATRPPPATTAA